MPPKVLGRIFSAIPESADPNLLVGFREADDAGVYRLDDRVALVQTVDFFAPIVDDPEVFGAIGAANALSDVYAMGGRPLTALSLVCFPHRELSTEILAGIVAGGAAKVAESGAKIVGGHSVNDQEIKFGYAVTGLVDPGRIWHNHTPSTEDRLLLTKPLGTGLLTTAVRKDLMEVGSLEAPVREMTRLNRAARDAAADLEVHAATDITGYGLLGHLFEMLRERRLGAEIRVEALPLFDGVWRAIDQKAFTGAHTTNKEYVSDYGVSGSALDRYEKVLYDPQTSGGLLFALPADQAEELERRLRRAHHDCAIIGQVTGTSGIRCR